MKKIVFALVVLGVVCAGGPQSAQTPRQSPTAGYVDPTVASFNSSKPMRACTVSCSASLINQNTDALQKAFDLANGAGHPWIKIPPGEYPVFRGGASHNQHYGALLAGYSGIVVDSPGAVIRISGDCTVGGDLFEIQLTGGTSNVRFLPGITFSGRDAVNCSEHTHLFQLGNAADVVDNIVFDGVHFVEPTNPGDCINLIGGYDAQHLIQRVAVYGSDFDCHRAAITYQHGTAEVQVVGNTFQGAGYTDQVEDHEPTSPGGNIDENHALNVYRPTAVTHRSATITTSGSGATQAARAVYAWNQIYGEIVGLNVRQSWFLGNNQTTTTGDGGINLSLFRRADDTWVVGNTSTKAGNTVSGPLVRLSSNNGYDPKNAWVRDNTWEATAGSSGLVTCVTKALLADSDYLTVNDGGGAQLYELDKAGDGCTPGRNCVSLTTAVTSVDVCAAIGSAIHVDQPSLTSLTTTNDSGTGLAEVFGGTGTMTMTENVANAGFTVRVNAVGSGLELDGVADAWVTGNVTHYRAVSADFGSNGWCGVMAFGAGTTAPSGWVQNNTSLRGLLLDGVTPAGRPLCGVLWSSSTYAHVGHVSIRDNLTDGAQRTFTMAQATLDDGPPVISGNRSFNVGSEQLPGSYLLESTGAADAVASGALSPSTRYSRLAATSAGTNHSLAEGVSDGQLKLLRWYTGAGDDTLTIAHFGDGSTITVSSDQIAAGARASLAWDAAGGKWWLLDSANITVNP